MSALPNVEPVRYCENCGEPLTRKQRASGLEPRHHFAQRRFCDLACVAVWRNQQGRVLPFPTPVQAFTRGYRRALAAGVDPLEALDAVYECSAHGQLHCEVCEGMA